MKKVKIKPLPKIGAEQEKNAKYFLDSARVRSALFALIPTIVLLLKTLGIEVNQVVLQQYVEVASLVVGCLGSIYNLYVSYKKGDILFFKK